MADLELRIEDGVANLTMNRPQARNALSMDMRAQIDEAFHQMELDDAVRSVVLTGAGDSFMAGSDVKNMHEYLSPHEEAEVKPYFLHRIHNLHTMMYSMRRMPKPVIAKVRDAAAVPGGSLAAA
ncbi:MAG: 2-(1,2-epoxy-1,2-dihydrophenyl)acetyl-CoA isomerase [Gammaproteobacteria bacterium]|jgi:2-(1,2-epoxy-1,2-dihydrophenyl)acetyl-CoA isomerase